MLTLRQFVSSDYCLKCQGCCKFIQQDSMWLPILLNEEIEDLLKRNFPPALISQGKKIRSEPYLTQNNFICSFFQAAENKCKIYAFRPFECQLYPFLINQKDKEIFLAVDLRCPFVKENLESQEYQKYIEYLANFFHGPNVIKTLRNNPQIIQTYSEVLNLVKIKF